MNNASPLQAARYSLQKIELSVFIEFLVFLFLFFGIITNRVLVTVFPDCPGKVAISPELRSPKLFLDLGHRLKISRAVRLLIILTTLVTL